MNGFYYFSRGVQYWVGTGSQVKFWDDALCCENFFKVDFLELFCMGSNNYASIADCFGLNAGIVSSPLKLRTVN